RLHLRLDPRGPARCDDDDRHPHLQRGVRVLQSRLGGCPRHPHFRVAGHLRLRVRPLADARGATMISQAFRQRLGGTLRLFTAGLLAAVLLFPIYWMAQTAILPTSDVLSRTPSLL